MSVFLLVVATSNAVVTKNQETHDYICENSDGIYTKIAPLHFFGSNGITIMPFVNTDLASGIDHNTQQPLGNNNRTWILFSHDSTGIKNFVLSLLIDNPLQQFHREYQKIGQAVYNDFILLLFHFFIDSRHHQSC